MRSRTKLPPGLSRLLLSEMEKAIYEANLGEEDTFIAEHCLVSRWPHADIAAGLNYDRSTISKRMPGILERVERAAAKLGIE